jgi:excisionase family DNA binding protein
MSGPDLLTIKTVAARLNVTDMTVRRLIYSGKLTAVYPSERTVRITSDSLQRHLVAIGAIEPQPTAS